MNLKNFLGLISLLLFISSCNTVKMVTNEQKVSLQNGYQAISRAKEEGIAIRLRSNARGIAALRQANHLDRAAEEQQKVETENEAILTSFREHFTFSPLYYFYGEDSENLQAGNLSVLKNVSTGQADASTVPSLILNPYEILNESTGSYNVGFSLENTDGSPLHNIIPAIRKRRLLTALTTDQMVYDLNTQLEAGHQWLTTINKLMEVNPNLTKEEVDDLKKSTFKRVIESRRAGRPTLKPSKLQ